MENESTPSIQPDASAVSELDRARTMGERDRAAHVKSVRPDLNTPERIRHSEDDDIIFTTRDREKLRGHLSAIEHPVTRRELRQQEHEAYKKSHRVKYLGYRALCLALKPFSK